MPYEVSDVEFDRLVEAALAQLPVNFRVTIEESVPIRVVPRPEPQMLAELGMEPDELLLGLFEGIAMPDLQIEASPGVPARIWLFKEDIEDASEDGDDLVEQVRITLLHELGHYFGMDEEDLDRLGYG